MAKLVASTRDKTSPQIYATVSSYDGVLHPSTRKPTLCKIREMRKHPTVSLARQLVIAPVLAAHWNYLTKDNAPEGAKEFIEKELAPLRLQLLNTTFKGYIDFGWIGYEKIFQVRKDGWIGLKKLKPLLQHLTDIIINPKNGAYAGLKQDACYLRTDEVNLSVPETLLVALDVEGTDWRGTSIFESTEVAYDQYEVVRKGADRYDKKIAGSHWVIHYPPGESEYKGEDVSNDEIAQDILRMLEASGKVAVPRTLEAFTDEMNKSDNAWKIEILSDSSNASSNFIERMRYLDNLLVRSFGVPERTVLEGQFGTKAEAGEHGNAAVINIDMKHRLAAVEYNKHLVDHLLRINWGEDAAGTVYIEPAPLESSQRKLLTTIYDRVLQSPESGPEEIASIDTETLKSDLGIPYLDDYEFVEKGVADVLYP